MLYIMKLSDHIDKISWSLGDKVLFILYGFVTILQFIKGDPIEMGLFSLLFSIFSWIFIISDSFALQNIIQFGVHKSDRPHVNFVALSLHTLLTLGSSLLIFFLRQFLADLFKEPRLESVFAYLPILTLLNIPRTYAIKVFYRDARMKSLFFSNLIYFGIMTAVTIYFIFSLGKINFENLIMIYITGTAFSGVFTLLFVRNDLKFSRIGTNSLRKILKFSTPYMLSSSVHLAPRQLDSYPIQFFFSTEVVGVYFLAKNLFRVFEEVINAANGLIYPAAVRQIEKNDMKSLNDMMTKSISFLFFFNIITVIILNLGLTELIVSFILPQKYLPAIPQFNILAIVSLGLPFTILGGIITAFGKPQIALKMMLLAIIFWAVAFALVGIIGNPLLIAIPHIIYYGLLSIMLFHYANKHFGFKFKQIFRVFKDLYYMIKQKI